MIVTFALQEDTGDPPATERVPYMIASVRRYLPPPTARIIQLSNETFPAAPGIDEIQRHPNRGDFITWGYESMIKLCTRFKSSRILQLATDILLQQDVSEIFDTPFDVAATRYPLSDRPDRAFCGEVNFIQRDGVEFLKHVLDIYKNTPVYYGTWDGGQAAMRDAAFETKLTIRELNPYYHCRTPESADEDMSDAAIVHFRGPRKAWMIPCAKKLGL